MTVTTEDLRALSQAHSAHNYHTLPIVIAAAEGAWVTDAEGRRYLDMLAAYSALNFGHRHPALIAAAQRQLDRVTLVSRAFDHDQFGLFCAELADLAGMEMVLPMNTGAEAVETAIKTARKRGDEVKGVPAAEAAIAAVHGTVHCRPPPRPGRSSASPPTPTPGPRSGRTPPGSASCRMGTPTPWPPRWTPTWSASSSSRSRVRPAWWCRRRATWPPSGNCARRTGP
jgi:ornithine--oxo-acid transaminase